MRPKVLILVFGIIAVYTTQGVPESFEKRILKSREITARFGAELKSHLQSALLKGGPTEAVSVCSEIAPDIARRFSNQTGWEIGRTALKYRNPDNAPDEWEKKILKKFQKQKQAGQPIKEMETHAVIDMNGSTYFRYMKAIPTQGICVTCHGASLAPKVSEAIDKHYPNDQARGFTVGDIRGAFSIIQPMDTKNTPE
ncbi:MAG: DUF3365 domain-containing protein [Desulfobacterales bacterium]